MASEQFSLCWDNFHKNMSSGMNSLLENEDLVDVTLAVEGKYLKAHKMVLSVCSPYFRELFKVNPCKHPIVFMKDVSYIAMSDLLQFMYQGEVQVSQENLTTFIKTAEALQIKGLTGDGNGSAECDNEPHEEPKAVEHEMPKVGMMRPKKMHQQTPPAPAPKRPRISAPEPSSAPAVTKTEPIVTSAPSNEQLIQFKMEPYDQGQSSVTIPDDNPDDTFTDDPLDETNADDGNEDYSMMEGGDEEPQAGTSADGTAGEGQESLDDLVLKIESGIIEIEDDGEVSVDNLTSQFYNSEKDALCPLRKSQWSHNDEEDKLNSLRFKLNKIKEENRKLRAELRSQEYPLDYRSDIDDFNRSQINDDAAHRAVGERRGREVHIGQGIYIPIQIYDGIISHSKSTKHFVKNMAVAVFGYNTLMNSSVTGKISNRTKTSKPQLDATKLRAVRDIFKHYLMSKNTAEIIIELELQKCGGYIAQKIADLCKQKKKVESAKNAEEKENKAK